MGKILSSRVAHQNDTDFGRAVHAADLQSEGLLDEFFGGAVDRLAGKRHFFKRVLVLRRTARIFHHSIVRRRG